MDYIVGFLKVTPSLYRYFQTNGLIRDLGDGIDKIDYLKAKEIDGGVMVVVLPDGGEKYLSTELCDYGKCLACIEKYGIPCAIAESLEKKKA